MLEKRMIVQLEQVSQTFVNKQVFRDVNLSVYSNQIVAIIGANGSGKSTLLRILTGLVKPTSGAVVQSNEIGPLTIGYAPDRFPWLRLTPWEYLVSMTKMQGLDLTTRIADLLDYLGLTEAMTKRMTSFSKGMLQKVNLIQAVLTSPDLLLLDEPLSGLDASSQQNVVHLLRELRDEGVGVVISSHEPMLINAVADRVITLDRGNAVESIAASRITIVCITCRLPSAEMAAALQQAVGVRSMRARNDVYQLYIGSEAVDRMLKAILDGGGSVASVVPQGRWEGAREVDGADGAHYGGQDE